MTENKKAGPVKEKIGKISPRRVRAFFGELGPGLITGAADDDPSGISTYSVTGASFGYAPLWTALFSFPLMVAVQIMCARLGMVTGRGLAGVLRRNYSRWVLWGACSLLIVANVVNIAADLGGMADATAMMTGIKPLVFTPIYATLITSLLFWTSYQFIARQPSRLISFFGRQQRRLKKSARWDGVRSGNAAAPPMKRSESRARM